MDGKLGCLLEDPKDEVFSVLMFATLSKILMNLNNLEDGGISAS